MGTAFVGAVLIGIVCLIVKRMVRDKKKGKAGCGDDCGRCRGCH